MRIIVQSERAPAFLEERVDAFLDEMQETLQAMTDSEFQEHKHGLEKKWSEDPKNLKEETNKFWYQIDSGYLDFYRRKSISLIFLGLDNHSRRFRSNERRHSAESGEG